MSADNLVELQEVHKSFIIGEEEVEIVHGISFKISSGDFLVIFGPSGCGKSTTLHIILGLEPPTSGKVTFLGKDLYSFTPDERAAIRKKHVGMVYQQANWIKSLNVIDNVAFPLTLTGMSKSERDKKAVEVLEMVEMADRVKQFPTELSAGQQQRIALARALVSDPELIIADEPTGNLDSKASEEMMGLFKKLNQEEKRTIVMVTHDLEYLKYATRAVNIIDGKIAGEYKEGDKELDGKMISKRGHVSATVSSAREKEEITEIIKSTKDQKPNQKTEKKGQGSKLT